MNFKKSIIAVVTAFLIYSFSIAQPGTSWQLTGPDLFPMNITGQVNGIGRVCQLKFHPTDPQKMYAVSASGGLWISNDTAHSWLKTGTDNLPATACASVCIDYTNDNVLYLGTGDPNYYYATFGIWKSTDGGATWAQSNTGMGNRLPVEILMAPTNNNILVAATDIGIYKSTDAGASWNIVKAGGDFKDMQFQPGSNSNLYAVTSSEFWYSTNFGNTWAQTTSANGFLIPGSGSGNGMRIAVSPAAPNIVYVGMVTDNGTILKSTDGGINFSTVYHNTTTQTLVGYDSADIGGGQGDYNFSMTADPYNANIVFLIAHIVWRSMDGGLTWVHLTDWYNQLHTDMHGIRFHPTYANKIFNVNDGGVWLSTDGGDNWVPKSNGIGATEIYHASQSPIKRDMISIGTQDNGELYYEANTWKTNRGGDWSRYSQFDYLTNNMVYYGDGYRRPVNGGVSYFGLPDTVSKILEFSKKINTLGFSGFNDVWRSTDLNISTPNWTNISNINQFVMAINSSPADSNMLYFITDNDKIYRSDNALAPSPTFLNYTSPAATFLAASIAGIKSNANVVYISAGSQVYRSANKGSTWQNITYNLPSGINIIKIIHDEYTTNESIYACSAKGVYYKNSGMSVWQNISHNLPTVANIQDFMIYNSGNAGSLLRVSYYGRGVWELPLNTIMPPVPDFLADITSTCTTQSVNFNDLSFGSPTSWNWTFAGGTPATSNQQNPTVIYSTPGAYIVKLVVSNSNGSDSISRTINVNFQHIPFTESFTNVFPPDNWKNYDDGNDGVKWQQSTLAGGFGMSATSTCFNNYNYNVSGLRDELRTPQYDFTSILHPKLTFNRAYARMFGYHDSLAVLVSINCGLTYNLLFLKGDSVLATAPDMGQMFIPLSNQWVTDTIDLVPFAGQNNVLFAFQNRGHYGQVIYIDNITISDGFASSVTEKALDKGLNIFPNPNKGTFTIKFSAQVIDNYTIEIVNILGQLVYTEKLNLFKADYQKVIDIGDFGKGIYFLNLKNSTESIIRKVIME